MAPVRDGDGAVTVGGGGHAGRHRDAARDRRAGAQRGPPARGRADGRRRQLGVRPGQTANSPSLPASPACWDSTDVERLTFEAYLGASIPRTRAGASARPPECMRTGAVTCEYRVIWPDGSDANRSSARAELVARGRRMVRRRCAARSLDVTEQRAAERERLAAEHLFRDGLRRRSDRHGPVRSGRPECCVRVDDALCASAAAAPREELIGPVDVRVHPSRRQGRGLDGARADARPGTRSGVQPEHRLLRPDGQSCGDCCTWLRSAAPTARSRPSHTQVVDITERKEREAQLEQHVGDAVWLGAHPRRAGRGPAAALRPADRRPDHRRRPCSTSCCCACATEDGSVIAPGEFLPVAERYGLISEIDRWVIRQAVRDRGRGHSRRSSTSSARSVGDPADHPRARRQRSRETGVDPSLLVVEVTETALLGRTGHRT